MIEENELEQTLLKILKNEKSVTKLYVLTRLYDDFRENLKNKRSLNTSIVDMKIALNNIEENAYKIEKYQTKDLKELMYTNLYLLKSYMTNISADNKKNIDNIIETITLLEVLLKLDISYPYKLKNCLKTYMNKDYIEKKYIEKEEYNIKKI